MRSCPTWDEKRRTDLAAKARCTTAGAYLDTSRPNDMGVPSEGSDSPGLVKLKFTVQSSLPTCEWKEGWGTRKIGKIMRKKQERLR